MTPLATLRALPMRRTLLVGGALFAGIVLGAGGLAVAAGGPMAGPWHHGAPLERVQHVVARALDGVGATAAQEAKIHDIVAAALSDMDGDHAAREQMHQQAVALLRAPTLDRAAVEALRVQQVAKFDAMSKKVVTAVLDAADQLNPEQRTKLADRADDMMRHRAMMGGHWGGPHRHGMDGQGMDGHGPDHDGQGPDGEPGGDNGPDKG